MIILVVVASLAAAFLNAWSAVVQRREAGKPKASELFSRNFIISLAKNRLWLGGLGLQILAFLAQGLALHQGSLTVVEPVMTTDLIFLMLLLRWQFKFVPKLREWSAVAALAVGLSGLLIAANPHGGSVETDNLKWAMASGAIAAFIAISIFIVRRSNSRKFRAALAGTAAGFNFALTAAFTKLVVEQLDHGLIAVLSSWAIYALAVSGVVSIIVIQSTYGAGPLADSQPAIEISDPVISILIGILLFGDTVNHSASALVAEVISAIVLGVGIVLMAGSDRIHESRA